MDIKKYLTFADIHNPLSALVIENTKSITNEGHSEFDGMWASSLTESSVKGKPDIEAVDVTSRLQSINEMLEVSTKPIIFDVTHSLQLPGGLGSATGGRREYVLSLAKAGISQSIAGLFLEAHPDPDQAKCDGPCALRLDMLEPFLKQIKDLDEFVKNQEDLEIK